MTNNSNLETPWKEQMRGAFRSSRELASYLESHLPMSLNYPVFVPKALARKIKKFGEKSPLWRQFAPSNAEKLSSDGLLDPIGDQVHAKQGQLIHRYENRALFLPTNRCPVICRYCFRKNELYDSENSLFEPNLEHTKNYLQDHPEINEIIFSGGDPLTLSDQKIASYAQFFATQNVPFLRFHSRFPVIIPERVDDSFVTMIKNLSTHFKLITLVIHTNHLDEICPRVEKAFEKLRGLPIQLFSQTVLLRKVNDNASDLENLFTALSSYGIIPYYLHHPDRVKGARHFQISIEEGKKIYRQLKDKLPGWATPRYVIDLPGGHGKVSLDNAEHLEFSGSFFDRYQKKHTYSDIKNNTSQHNDSIDKQSRRD